MMMMMTIVKMLTLRTITPLAQTATCMVAKRRVALLLRMLLPANINMMHRPIMTMKIMMDDDGRTMNDDDADDNDPHMVAKRRVALLMRMLLPANMNMIHRPINGTPPVSTPRDRGMHAMPRPSTAPCQGPNRQFDPL
jgi:hypothetical protein